MRPTRRLRTDAYSVRLTVTPSPCHRVTLSPASFVLRLSSFVIFLAACASPPTVPPPPTPAAVRVLSTDLTAPLVLDLADAYSAVNPNVAVVPLLAVDDPAA